MEPDTPKFESLLTNYGYLGKQPLGFSDSFNFKIGKNSRAQLHVLEVIKGDNVCKVLMMMVGPFHLLIYFKKKINHIH